MDDNEYTGLISEIRTCLSTAVSYRQQASEALTGVDQLMKDYTSLNEQIASSTQASIGVLDEQIATLSPNAEDQRALVDSAVEALNDVSAYLDTVGEGLMTPQALDVVADMSTDEEDSAAGRVVVAFKEQGVRLEETYDSIETAVREQMSRFVDLSEQILALSNNLHEKLIDDSKALGIRITEVGDSMSQSLAGLSMERAEGKALLLGTSATTMVSSLDSALDAFSLSASGGLTQSLSSFQSGTSGIVSTLDGINDSLNSLRAVLEPVKPILDLLNSV